MNFFECTLGFESADGIVYKMGGWYTEEEYNTLTSSEKRFFRQVKDNEVINK